MSAKKTKVGIISANWSLKVHGTAWRNLPGVEVAAICTAHRETAEAAAQQFGIGKAYWDHRKMLEDDELDIIDLGTRPSFRQSMVLDALRAGKHVYSALPFATDLASAVSIEEARRESGVVGVVDAQFRWVPAALHMKKLIDSGFLGKPLGFNVQLFLPLVRQGELLYPHSAYPGAGVAPYKWLAEKDSGAGGWRNFATHSLLLLTHMLGPVAEATGRVDLGVPTWTLPDASVLESGNEDLGVATLCLRNGAIGNLQAGWSVPDAAGLRFEVWGDKGRMLLVDPGFGDGISARLYRGDARPVDYGQSAGEWLEIPKEYFAVPGTPFNVDNAPPMMVSMGWMFHHMLAAIEGSEAASPSFSEAVHAQQVVEAVLQSSRDRSWKSID